MKLLLLIIFITFSMQSCSKNKITVKLKEQKTTLAYNESFLTLDSTSSIILKTNNMITPFSPSNIINSSEYTFSAKNLPTGLLINALTGEISGTPSIAGQFDLLVTARLKTRTNNSKVFSKTIKVIDEIAPSNLLYDVEYILEQNQTIQILKNSVIGNFLQFSAIGLPPGLIINESNGTISGVYEGNGITSQVIITATNNLGSIDFTTLLNFNCSNDTLIKINNVCINKNQTRSCASQPDNSTGGSEFSTDGGVTWSSCFDYVCSLNFSNINGSCLANNQTRSCLSQPDNSTGGTEATSNAGISWSACSSYTCSALYSNINGICVLTNQTRSCLSQPDNSNGGIESSSDAGSTWGSCSSFSCNASYTNINGSCVLTNQTRSCLSQPANSTGGMESSSDGGATWGTCSSFSCSNGYSVSGSSCAINTYSVTVNKIINQAAISDITLSQINAGVSDTSVSHNYDYGQMIVFEATPEPGFVITGWTGCDSVSNDFLRCTISSISADRTIVPTIENSYFSLSFSWENATISSLVGGYAIFKNGISCADTCLTSIIQSDVMKVSVTPGSVFSNVSSWSMTGNTSNLNTTVSNEATFTMGNANATITPIIVDLAPLISDSYSLDLEEVATPHNQIAGLGSINPANKNQYLYISNQNSIRFYITSSGLTNAREMSFFTNDNCTGSPTWITKASNYGPLSLTDNSANQFSYKFRNITQETACKSITIYKKTSISKTTETIVLNSVAEGSNGFNSFFNDTDNTISGVCIHQSSLGNLYLYNYGLTEYNIVATIKAFNNSDLVNPYFSVNHSGGCSSSNDFSITIPSNAAFASADVISVTLNFKNYFEAILQESITTTIVQSTRACSISNGTGSQTYNSNGSYNTCNVTACDATFTQSGNTCVSLNQSRSCLSQPANSIGGTESTTNGGSTWSQCSGFSCSADYQLSADSLSCESIIIPHIKNFSTNTDNSCSIKNNGAGYCWGWNGYGSIGDGSNTDSSIPVSINSSGVLSGKTLKQISVGDTHVCAIASDDKVYCWGDNTYGALGNNSTTNSSSPVAVSTSGVLSGKTILSVAAGSYFTCALASDNKVYCWGRDNFGQLGNMNTTTSLIPVAVDTSATSSLNGKTVLQIAVNDSSVCAISNDYKGHCWGKNGTTMGILGANNGTWSLKTYPVAIYSTGVLSGKTLRQISGNSDSATFCAIASDNQAYCWGDSADGQVGNNSWSQSIVPAAVSTSGVLSGKNIKSISTGYHHTCALTDANTVACWGRGANGQLGDGLLTASPIPVNIDQGGALIGKTIVDITTGWYSSCAKTSDSKIYCWGWNNAAQFGIQDDWSEHSVPIQAIPSFSF